MIANLKPYPQYKESGLPWVGQIPQNWEVRRTKYLLKENDSRSTDGSEQLLRVSQYSGVSPRRSLTDDGDPDTRASSLKGYKKVEVDDLAINIMLAWNGSLGVSRHRGIVSPAYCVYRFNEDLFPWYFHHLFKTPLYKDRIKALSTGVVESRLRLYTDDLGRLESIVPPPSEQAAIVRFLDHANGKIDRYVRAKKKLITLLNEQKQAIIHRAVTRGLNPDAPLKPSGIDWLGEIPKHWEVLRAKYLFREVDERSKTGEEEQLSVSHLTGVTPRSQKNVTMFKAESYVGHKICRVGDLVINTMWAWMAALGVSRHNGIISPAYGVYRQHMPKRLDDEFADLLLRTETYRANYVVRSTGVRASRLRLYPDAFFKIPIIIPPSLEQKEILAFIRQETAGIEAAITRTEREIELLEEYRTKLTADVVTGKLDVRVAAENLPEIPKVGNEEPGELLDAAGLDEEDAALEGVE